MGHAGLGSGGLIHQALLRSTKKKKQIQNQIKNLNFMLFFWFEIFLVTRKYGNHQQIC